MKRAARLGAGGLVLTLALATVLVRLLGQGLGLSWRLDLASGAAGVMAAACALGAAVVLLLRMRRAALVLALVACGHVVWMGYGRAPRARIAGNEPRILRVMTFNALGINPHGAKVLDAVRGADADLVCILEASWSVQHEVTHQDWVAERYPHRIVPQPGREWNIIVLSRYPMTIGEMHDDRWESWWDYYNYRRVTTVHAPWGDFMHAMLIPSSPRNPDRWRMGNELLEDNIAILRRYYRSTGLPLVVTADLNASPTMWRTGRVRRALGLRRCKPLWGIEGTWPAENPAWKRFAIDDVLVSAGIGVAGWRVIEAETGSDHAPVVVDLVMPAVRADGQ